MSPEQDHGEKDFLAAPLRGNVYRLTAAMLLTTMIMAAVMTILLFLRPVLFHRLPAKDVSALAFFRFSMFL
jgi:hypothetical protein